MPSASFRAGPSEALPSTNESEGVAQNMAHLFGSPAVKKTSFALLPVGILFAWMAAVAVGQPSDEDAFKQAMTEGHRALPDNPVQADEWFRRALALSPNDPNALDGIASAQRLRTDAELQGLRREMRQLLAVEDWGGALVAVEQMEALAPQSADDDLRLRLVNLVELERGLDRYLQRPERLGIPAGRQRALSLVAAEGEMGQRIFDKIDRLRALLEQDGPPRAQLLLHVSLCQSVRLQPGRDLGAVRGEVALDVAPGDYHIIGVRRGYREARAQATLSPGETLRQAIVCDERI